MSFEQAHPSLQTALAARGYTDPTPVQTAVLAPDAQGRDLLVTSRTGSGKTVAFGMALAPQLLGESSHMGTASAPKALVIAPTRELAMQVQRELAWLYAGTGARVVACVGGMDPRREQRALRDGAHIVVGTPGRLCDHLDRENLRLSELVAVVLDEADEMLDLGFKEELERLLGAAPATRRTLLFSATLPRETLALARGVQTDAFAITATDPREAHADIEYRGILVAARELEHAVVNVLRVVDAPGALVFCNTRESVAHLHSNLLERGFSAVTLSGELTQAERSRALQALRDGRARVLVATDVAARGLDLPDLGLVLHAELPIDSQVLLHRSGRTGRAGKKGLAVALVPLHQRRLAERLFRGARVRPTLMQVPTPDDILAKDQERLTTELSAVEEAPSEEDLSVAKALLAAHSAESLVARLVAIQRAQRPTAEDLPETLRLRDLPDSPPPRRDFGPAVWFRINLGRADNVNPQRLLPLLCDRGNVPRGAIGKIDIRERETGFQVAEHVVARFAKSAGRPDRRLPDVRIERV